MDLDFLRRIGLSDGEIRIYSVLLESGSCKANLLHEKTGIERRNIYDILNKLIGRGLVSYVVENKKRFFQISHPNKILGYIEEKKSELEKTKNITQKEIPEILRVFESKKTGIHAEIYRGVEGIKAVWEDILNYREIYWIGSGRYVPKMLPQWFTNWNRRRIKSKVKFFNLMRQEMIEEIKTPFEYESIKFLPKEFSGNPTVISIFGDKVTNFIFTENLFAFVIESKELAENYKKYHKYLWDNVAKEKIWKQKPSGK